MPAPTESKSRRMADKRYHTAYVLTVDADKFRAEFARHGATTNDQIAALIHTDSRTVRRVRSGEVQPSAGFHANCLAAKVDFSAFVAYRSAGELKVRAA